MFEFRTQTLFLARCAFCDTYFISAFSTAPFCAMHSGPPCLSCNAPDPLEDGVCAHCAEQADEDDASANVS